MGWRCAYSLCHLPLPTPGHLLDELCHNFAYTVYTQHTANTLDRRFLFAFAFMNCICFCFLFLLIQRIYLVFCCTLMGERDEKIFRLDMDFQFIIHIFVAVIFSTQSTIVINCAFVVLWRMDDACASALRTDVRLLVGRRDTNWFDICFGCCEDERQVFFFLLHCTDNPLWVMSHEIPPYWGTSL